MNREVLDRWCERGITGLALAVLVLLPLSFGGRPQPPVGCFLDFLLMNPFAVACWLALPLLALWSARLWLMPKPRLLWPPICWAVVAFVGYAIGRYLTSDIEYVARQELIQVLVYAFFFFIIINNLHRQETTQLISLTLVFLAMAISFLAVYQFLSHSTRVWHVFSPYHNRGSGTYICPNHLGGFLEMILPLGLAYTLMGRFKPVVKVLLGYASLVILAGLGATVSRGAWLSTAVALLLFFAVLMLYRTYRLPAIVLLAVILAGGGILFFKSPALQIRLKQLVSPQGQVNDDARFGLWRPALKVWQQNIWWGAGPAHFDYRFGLYRPESVQARPDRAHNDYLNTLADWGLIGTALVALAWGLLGAGAWKTWRFVRRAPADIGGKSSNSKFAFVLGSTLGLVAILVHSLVDFNMHIPANALLAVTLMALLSSHLRFATDNYWFTATTWTKALLTGVIAAGLFYLGSQSWRGASEKRWLARAAMEQSYSSAQVECLRRAFAVEPMNPDTIHAVGEAFRLQSMDGDPGYQEKAAQAMQWFDRTIKLNPWDSDSFLRYGWCLDWLDRPNESAHYFDQAEQLDPNNYFTVASIGLHYVQLGNFAAAKPWFERSIRLQWSSNDVARVYLELSNRRLLEAATNRINSRPLAPQR